MELWSWVAALAVGEGLREWAEFTHSHQIPYDDVLRRSLLGGQDRSSDDDLRGPKTDRLAV
jgi:hypothetical protein